MYELKSLSASSYFILTVWVYEYLNIDWQEIKHKAKAKVQFNCFP